VINSDDDKREIKIFKKKYRLPVLAGGKLDKLQQQIKQRNDCLTRGRIVVKKVEKKSLFSKKIIEERSRKALNLLQSCQNIYRIWHNGKIYDLGTELRY
jgi:hypothetical protein